MHKPPAIREAQSSFPSKTRWPIETDTLRDMLSAASDATLPPGLPAEVEVSVHTYYRWSANQKELSPATTPLLNAIRRVFPPLTQDRVIGNELAAISALIQDRSLETLLTPYCPDLPPETRPAATNV